MDLLYLYDFQIDKIADLLGRSIATVSRYSQSESLEQTAVLDTYYPLFSTSISITLESKQTKPIREMIS